MKMEVAAGGAVGAKIEVAGGAAGAVGGVGAKIEAEGGTIVSRAGIDGTVGTTDAREDAPVDGNNGVVEAGATSAKIEAAGGAAVGGANVSGLISADGKTGVRVAGGASKDNPVGAVDRGLFIVVI